MNFKDSILLAATLLVGLATSANQQGVQGEQSLQGTVDQAIAEVLNMGEEERIRDARIEVCRQAAGSSQDSWDIYERAVSKDASLGPAVEIAKRCQFFIAGILYRIQQQKEELRREIDESGQ